MIDLLDVVPIVALVVAAASLVISVRSSRAARSSASTAARALDMAQNPRLELTDATGSGPVKLSLDEERLMLWIANWGRGSVRIERIDLVSRVTDNAGLWFPFFKRWSTSYARIRYAGSSEPRIMHEGGKDGAPVAEISIPLASALAPSEWGTAVRDAINPAEALLGPDTSGVDVAVELTVRALLTDEEAHYHAEIGVGNVSGSVYTHGLAVGPFVPRECL